MTVSLYVESGYWDSGYTEDITVTTVDTSSVIAATATILSGGQYLQLIAGKAQGTATTIGAGSYVMLEGALSEGSATTLAASLRKRLSSSIFDGLSTSLVAVEVYRTYPGVNLNAKSSVLAAIGVTRKTSSIIASSSSTKAGARLFWEATSPASGAWTTIDPQAEGSGK